MTRSGARKKIILRPQGAKKKRGPKKSESEKFLEECKRKNYVCSAAGVHVLEILEEYTKKHVMSGEPAVLRELLRNAHKLMPDGPPKSKIRGILVYLTRSTMVVTWMKVAKVLKAMADIKAVTTFAKPREIPFDRIVDSTTILQMSTNPKYGDRIKVMDAKIERLKGPQTGSKKGKKTTGERPTGMGELPSLTELSGNNSGDLFN